MGSLLPKRDDLWQVKGLFEPIGLSHRLKDVQHKIVMRFSWKMDNTVVFPSLLIFFLVVILPHELSKVGLSEDQVFATTWLIILAVKYKCWNSRLLFIIMVREKQQKSYSCKAFTSKHTVRVMSPLRYADHCNTAEIPNMLNRLLCEVFLLREVIVKVESLYANEFMLS